MRRSLPLLALAGLLLLQACDEGESVLGGSPGGDFSGTRHAISLSAIASYHRNQPLTSAGRQLIGRDDSLGLEGALVFRIDYQPLELRSPAPAEGSVRAFFSMKLDNDPATLLLPQWEAPEDPLEAGFHLDLELLLLADSLGIDDLAWEGLAGAGAPDNHLASQAFRVSAADSAFGEDANALTGRRTFREVPGQWFQHADTTARFFLLRAAAGQRGLMPVLAAGWAAELRPGLRLTSWRVDTLLVDGFPVPDTTFDTTFVAATWQSGVLRDSGDPASLPLSTGWASQLMLELPPFPPSGDTLDWDPLTATLAEAYLRLPLAPLAYNKSGGKVNLYHVGAFDSAGVDLDPALLVASTVLDAESDTLSFSIVSVLRRHWIEADTLRQTDPVALAVKFDDFNLLEARKLTLSDPADPQGRVPSLELHVTRAPDSWSGP
jgi:hypothetical protein